MSHCPSLLHRRLFASASLVALSLAVVLAACVANATMIRCQDAAGRITYQDSTCPNGARGVPIDPYQSSGTRFATRDEINRAMKPEPPRKEPPTEQKRSRHRTSGDPAERRFIAPGTTAAQVRARIGEPDYTERAPGHGAGDGGPGRSAPRSSRIWSACPPRSRRCWPSAIPPVGPETGWASPPQKCTR